MGSSPRSHSLLVTEPLLDHRSYSWAPSADPDCLLICPDLSSATLLARAQARLIKVNQIFLFFKITFVLSLNVVDIYLILEEILP